MAENQTPVRFAAPRLGATPDREKREPREADFYVATNGSDEAAGTRAAPFATLERAQSAARTHRVAGRRATCTVRVFPGEYRISGLVLDSRDSNTVFSGYGDGEVVLNGGMSLDPAHFTPLAEAERDRLRGDARDAVVKVDLRRYGLGPADWGALYAVGAYHTAARYDGDTTGVSCELFFNNRRMTLARYPNGNEFLRIAAVLDVGDVAEFPEQNYFRDWKDRRNHRGGTYIMDRDTNSRVAGWRSLDNIWMFGYFYHDWADSSTPVDSFDTRVRVVKPKYVSNYACRAGAPYYFYNVFEELDEPGEWYLDRESGVLYLYPTDELESAQIDLSLTTREIIRAEGIEGLVVEGFTLKGTRADAISIAGHRNVVRDCRVINVAGNAVVIEGTGNVVAGCEISRTGRGGIRLTGGDRITLAAGNNVAEDNLIHDWSEVYLTYQPAVRLDGVGNVCRHNEIYNSPHMAINYYGNDHLIEYNLVHDVVLQSNDAGAIYSGQDWTAQGTVIRYNCLYDIGGPGFHPQGIYWDDALSGQVAYGNVLVNVARWAFQIGGGRDIVVRNNLIINALECAVAFDERARDGFVRDGWYRAGVVTKEGSMWQRLYAMPYQSETWSARYPSLARIRDDFSEPDHPDFGVNPSYAVVTGNIVVDANASVGRFAPSVTRYGTVDDNAAYGLADDPGFEDAAAGNYRFRPDAAALTRLRGWEPIPFESIGRRYEAFGPAEVIAGRARG